MVFNNSYKGTTDELSARPQRVYFWLILLIGSGLRLFGLGCESIDLEEYACLGALDAPDWWTFFLRQRDLYPYGAPLAPHLLYFWTRLVGDSIVAIRLLFALTGILIMPLIFYLARLLFSDSTRASKAGLTAMICVALSPVHVFHSQEARMYALVSLFALLSVITLLHGLRHMGRAWWWLHWVSNLCLLSSQYLTVFMLPVSGLVILLWERRLSARAVCWFVSHSLLVVVLALWVSQIPKQPDHLYSYYEIPTWSIILANFLAGDSTVLSANSFFPSASAWWWAPEPIRYPAINVHWFFDALLVFLAVAAIGGAGLRLWRHVRDHRFSGIFIWTLLLLWALLPFLLMMSVSLLFRPIYGSRYVMYSAFALYLMLGGMLARIGRQRFYAMAMVVIILTYGYQLSLALPAQTRAAWRQAFEQVQAESDTQALVLLEDPFWLPVMTSNLDKPPPLPIVAAFQRDTLCDAAELLAAYAQRAEEPVPEIWVLLVLTTDFDETPFTHCLRERGLIYERTFYSGDRRLALYRIAGASGALTQPVPADRDNAFDLIISALSKKASLLPDTLSHTLRFAPDWEAGIWLRLGVAFAQYGHHDWAGVAFFKAIQEHLGALYWLYDAADALDVALDPMRLSETALAADVNDKHLCERLVRYLPTAYYRGNQDRLVALGRAAIARATDCMFGYACLGLAEHRKEAHQMAIHWFEQAYAQEDEMPPEVIEAYGISLLETGNADEARTILEDGTERWPDHPWLRIRLATAYAALKEHAKAAALLREAHRTLPHDAYVAYLLLRSLLEMGAYTEAKGLARSPELVASNDIWVWTARWRAFAGAGENSEAAAVFRQISDVRPALEPLYRHLYAMPDPTLARAELLLLEDDDAPIAPELYMTLERIEAGKP